MTLTWPNDNFDDTVKSQNESYKILVKQFLKTAPIVSQDTSEQSYFMPPKLSHLPNRTDLTPSDFARISVNGSWISWSALLTELILNKLKIGRDLSDLLCFTASFNARYQYMYS